MKKTFLLIGAMCGLIFITRAFAQDNTLSARERKEGWKLLFDGKSTKAWKGAFKESFPEKGWKIEKGLLIVESSNGNESTNGGDIVTKQLFENFELSVDFKLTTGANSGIKYFVDPAQPAPANPRSALGLEYQLLDDAVHPDAKLGRDGNRTLGSLYDLITAPASKPIKPIGEWNNVKIVAHNNHVEHWLNGVKLFEYEKGSGAFKTLINESKYKTNKGFATVNKGAILLQDHGNEVSFKNIKIKELNGDVSKIGVVSYTFRNSFQKDVAGTLDRVKEMGFTNIEFSNLFGKTAVELKALLDERGMVCTSFGVTYPDLTTKTAEVAANAKALGATFVRVAWIPHDKAGFTIDDAKKTVNDFNKAGKILKDGYGLTFCYHNHGYEFAPYEQGTYFDYLAANTNPAYVSFELDILWAFHPGIDPAALIKKYPSRFKLMHVKDLRKGIKGDFSGGTAIENDVALGTGQINIPQVLMAAKKSSIQYFFIEDESNEVDAQVPVSLALLASVLSK